MIILTIKRKWYEMILKGIKKEEYRDIKPYYISRLEKHLNGEPVWIKFRNGYSRASPSFMALVTVSKGTGKVEWGAELGASYYVLSILQIEK